MSNQLESGADVLVAQLENATEVSGMYPKWNKQRHVFHDIRLCALCGKPAEVSIGSPDAYINYCFDHEVEGMAYDKKLRNGDKS